MLWVDKHRPKTLRDLTHHGEITARLKSLSENPSSMPHLLVYGPSGAGKKTRITALLRALYGPGAEKLKLDKKVFTTPTKRTVEVNMVTSTYHMELSPGDAGLNDRFVVQDVIKEMASNKNITSMVGTTGTTGTNTAAAEGAIKKSTTPGFKTVVLVDVDRLSRQAQAALRRTMEKYTSTCRLILCCNSPSKVIEPVRSRCLGIRVGAPTQDEICTILKYVAGRECVNLPNELAVNIARSCSRNCRRALLALEACHVEKRGDGMTADQAVQKTDWEIYIHQLAVEITREQTPGRLLAAREKLYELLVNCIPPSVILKTLAGELVKNLDDTLKREVFEWAAFYEHRIATGNKEIFHLEAFIAKYMALYKKYLNDLFG